MLFNGFPIQLRKHLFVAFIFHWLHKNTMSESSLGRNSISKYFLFTIEEYLILFSHLSGIQIANALCFPLEQPFLWPVLASFYFLFTLSTHKKPCFILFYCVLYCWYLFWLCFFSLRLHWGHPFLSLPWLSARFPALYLILFMHNSNTYLRFLRFRARSFRPISGTIQTAGSLGCCPVIVLGFF